MPNTIYVTTFTNEVIVNSESERSAVVTVLTAGPQGPQGEMAGSISQLTDVDITGAVNNSVLYYDSNNSTVRADNNWTTSTLTDGGNW